MAAEMLLPESPKDLLHYFPSWEKSAFSISVGATFPSQSQPVSHGVIYCCALIVCNPTFSGELAVWWLTQTTNKQKCVYRGVCLRNAYQAKWDGCVRIRHLNNTYILYLGLKGFREDWFRIIVSVRHSEGLG